MAKVKLSKLKYRDLIVVTWRDAGGQASWVDRELAAEPCIEMDQPCVFVDSDKTSLYVAQAIPNGHAGEHMVLAPSSIPLGCVLKVRKI